MSNSVGHSPQTLVFRPTHAGQVFVQSVIIPNVPSDADLTAGTSAGPFEVVRVVSYDRTSPGGVIGPEPVDESDGTPLWVRKGGLVEIFVQLTVPNQISGDLGDQLSVAGTGIGIPKHWGFSVPMMALLTHVTIEFPTEPFAIVAGETKAVPVKAIPGFSPPPSITLQYAPQSDPKFSVQPLTLSFQGDQPATGILSVACAGDAAPGAHYNLQFYVQDLAYRTVQAFVVQLRPSRWEFVGPKNYGIFETQSSPVSGRVNAVAFDPKRPGTWYLGAAWGGVWKTTNFGDTWTPLSDRWKFLPVSSIAIDPAAPDTIYVGTGDIPQPQGYAMGAMKSTDGGLNWSAVGPGVSSSVAVSKVLVDPRSPNIIWAAIFESNGQIWRSPNGGGTWSAASQLPSTWWLGIERAVSSSGAADRYYAVGEGVGAELWRTDDGGVNWVKLRTPLSPTWQQRPLIACSPIFPNNVYLFSPTDLKIFGSKDAGNKWEDITDNFADLGTALYTFCFACSYTGDPNRMTAQDVLYVGTASTYRSAPGGGQWTEVEGQAMGGKEIGHADQHAVAVDPFNPNAVLCGNDGGVFSATLLPDGKTNVSSVNRSLGITQVYRADYSFDSPPSIIAGTQDVGTAYKFGSSSDWSMVGGGDGGSCAINPRDPDFQYLQINFDKNSQMQLLKTGNRWHTSNDFAHPFMKYERRSQVAPIVLDPSNSRTLYLATNFLYRWVEPGEVEGGWEEHLGNRSLSSAGFVSAIAIAPSDSNRIYTGSNYTGSNDNELWMSTDYGKSWHRIDTGLPQSGGIASISVHPNNPSDILVALWYPGALWHCTNTIDSLIMWNDVTGRYGPDALPAFPTTAIARDPLNPDLNWFVGTDIGVFFTSNGGFNWFDATGPLGLPNVAIKDLKVVAKTGYIYAATFGRGIWQATL